VQRSGQPVSRTKTQGRPAKLDSPWMLWKISVMRMFAFGSVVARDARERRDGPVSRVALFSQPYSHLTIGQ
jgi:hypothetical protein